MFSKSLSVALVVYLLSHFSHGQKDRKFFRKDYTYIETEESFYKIHTTPQKWQDAKQTCALEGATFLHPKNNDEADAVISFWKRTQPGLAWMFSGMTELMNEGVFETIDGKSVSVVYNGWAPGQPDHQQAREHCICLNFKAMHDCWCDQKLPFICKKSLQSLEWNYCCNMYDLDYTFNKDIGKCYKLHRTPLNWKEAYATCRIEQSHLAVINNKSEADYLVQFTESAPKHRVGGNFQRGIYHLGFHNRFNEGWRTVKGTPLYADANAWWENYLPNEDDREHCGSMFFNGRLNSINCDTKSFFICEHEVDSSDSFLEVNEE